MERGGPTQAEVTSSRESLSAPESEKKNTVTPALSRVLAASATANPERFDPDKVTPLDTAPETDERSKIFSLAPDKLAYDAAEKVSLDSRGKSKEKLDDWKKKLKGWIDSAKTSKKAEDWTEEAKLRVKALVKLGAIDENGDADVDAFYDKYLKGKSNIEGFIGDLSELCTHDGVVDIT